MEEKSLVQLSTKSWHYQFMKFILGKLSPTPENMFNLCPYFWLFICSVLLSIPILVIRYILNFFGYIFLGLEWIVSKTFIEPTANSWHDNLIDLDIYQIWNHDMKIKKFYKMLYGDDYNYINEKSFAEEWWEKKYNEKVQNENPQEDGFYTDAFREWIKYNKKEYDELKYERSESSSLFEDKMDDIRQNVKDWFVDLGNKIISWKNLIKWTKRIVGIIVTGTGLFITYFVVNFLSRGILFLIEHWDWHIFWCIIVGLVIAFLVVAFFVLLSLWIEFIREKGLKLWYVKLAYYPLYWIVYVPLKIIIYYILWQFLIINIWALLKGGAKLIWGSFLGFLGIFGEYFGASYTDYCPGIEWKE